MDINWIDFVRPELLALIPVLYGISFFLKKTPKISPMLVPIIMLVVAIVVSFLHLYYNVKMTIESGLILVSIVQGTFLAMSTIVVKQIVVKQILDNSTIKPDEAISQPTELPVDTQLVNTLPTPSDTPDDK